MPTFLNITPAFPVHHISKAVEFYKGKFGFECHHEEKTFAMLSRGGIELHLWAANNFSWKWRSFFLFLQPIQNGSESFLAGTHSCRIAVNDIEDLYIELKEKQVLYNKKTVIENTYYGTKEFVALDLHRNLLTFYECI